MSIKFLIDQINKPNLAEDLDETTLTAIGSRVKRQYDEDLASMTEWINAVENGIELMKQEFHGRSTPWEGASNYKDSGLTEAAIVFGDKAKLELLRSRDLVSADIVGRDPEGKKKAISERICEAMNYQVNYDMEGWRKTQSRMFYNLPVVGACFKKLVHDPIDGKNESVLITYPNFVVNQATESMNKCRSFSHNLAFSRNDVLERVRCGKWLDPYPQVEQLESDKRGDENSNEQKDVVDAIDNPSKFVEQSAYYDLDDDGYEEPYLITFEYSSAKVVRILPRYDEQSIIVKTGEGKDTKYLPVSEVIKTDESQLLKEFGGDSAIALLGMEKPTVDPDVYELVRIEPFNNVVKYGFIPPPDNTFLDLGYAHLMGALVQNINTTTNQINDRSTLNNLGGGWLAKEFKVKQGQSRFRMGEYKQTEVPAEKLAKGIFPQPLQEPSATAYQMREKMEERMRSFFAIVDVSGKIQANTPPTTALAIIQEAIIPQTALFQGILEAESEEFQILYRINQRTFPVDKYRMILDVPDADPQADFNFGGLDIVPTANAEMSSKMHRIQTAELEMAQLPTVLQAGGNPVPLIKNFFDAIGSELIDQIFPEEGTMSPADAKARDEMLKLQQQQAEMQALQLDILKREQDRLDMKNLYEIQEISAKVKKLGAEFVETMAKAYKTAEEGESESLVNRQNTFAATIKAITDSLSRLGETNARAVEISQLQAPQSQPGRMA